MMRYVLAHQGGWDELLFFGVPVVLALLAVRWAERRAKKRAQGDKEPPGKNPASPRPADKTKAD